MTLERGLELIAARAAKGKTKKAAPKKKAAAKKKAAPKKKAAAKKKVAASPGDNASAEAE